MTAEQVHTKVETYYGALSLRDDAVISLGSDRKTAEYLLHDAREGDHPGAHPWRLVPPLLESTLTTVETVTPWVEVVSSPGQDGYCDDCGHPWGYHATGRGCTMPLDGSDLPVTRTDDTVKSCGCAVVPPETTAP